MQGHRASSKVERIWKEDDYASTAPSEAEETSEAY
jgi:hypothetical protein